MAKSTRSKVKRSFRAKKRTDGVYAAVEAARLHRLSMKLKGLATTDKDGDVEVEDAEGDDEREEEEVVVGEGVESSEKGMYWFCLWLGIFDESDVGIASMESLLDATQGML